MAMIKLQFNSLSPETKNLELLKYLNPMVLSQEPGHNYSPSTYTSVWTAVYRFWTHNLSVQIRGAYLSKHRYFV